MDPRALTAFVSSRLAADADPDKAGPMAAYMKTDMPFYGVQKTGRSKILRDTARTFIPADHDEYERAVLALWNRSHREEKYLAIGYARRFSAFVDMTSMPLYRRLVVEGAWWDFVDEVASHLVGSVLMDDWAAATPLIRTWISDEDMWLRRTAIICQLRAKTDTDTDLLADACLANIEDTEFFIRKAIGWALREFSKTDPEWVRLFVEANRGRMSGLSIREATKYLGS